MIDDQICMAKAAKEFKLSSSVLESAIESGVIKAERSTGRVHILLSRKELEGKLPFLRTGSRFLRIFSEQKERKPPTPEKTPLYSMVAPKPLIPRLERKVEFPLDPEKPAIIKVEGAPAWVSSPCINCKLNCDSETCNLLMKWAVEV